MGRAPCCEKVGLKRGRWTSQEDEILLKYIQDHGEGSWRFLPKNAGLLRCGKSCRLRWINYLRSDLKRGNFTAEEEDMIVKLHHSLGNRWSLIAEQLAGRSDNEIKNYWNTHLSRRIYTFTRPSASEDLTVKLALTKTRGVSVGRSCKRKINNKNAATTTSSNVQVSTKETTHQRDHEEDISGRRSSISREMIMGLEANAVQDDGQGGHVVNGPYQDSDEGRILGPREGGNKASLCCCSYEEKENEILVPHARLLPCSTTTTTTTTASKNNIQVMQSSGVFMTSSEKREHEMMRCSSEKGDSGGVFITCNGEGGEVFSSTSMTSCFGSEEEWNDLIWEDMVNGPVIWQEGEDMFSWM